MSPNIRWKVRGCRLQSYGASSTSFFTSSLQQKVEHWSGCTQDAPRKKKKREKPSEYLRWRELKVRIWSQCWWRRTRMYVGWPIHVPTCAVRIKTTLASGHPRVWSSNCNWLYNQPSSFYNQPPAFIPNKGYFRASFQRTALCAP